MRHWCLEIRKLRHYCLIIEIEKGVEMRFLLETLFWLVVTGLAVTWIWGFSLSTLAISLTLSLILSLVGGNLLFNQDK